MRFKLNNIEDFLASNSYSDATKRTYRDVITRVLAVMPPVEAASAADLVQAIQSIGWGNKRQCLALAAVKTFVRWKYGQLPMLSARIKRLGTRPQRALTLPQAEELLASFDTMSPKGARDLAICSLALDTGLRNSELCRVERARVDTERNVLQILVKGGQWRAAVFSPETSSYIERWKAFRQDLTTKHTRGQLFLNIQTGRGLTPEGLCAIVRDWGRRIGITLSPHDLRRSFAVLATLRGAPERVLMEGGRWAHSDMIKTYTRTLQLDAMRQYLPMSGMEKK